MRKPIPSPCFLDQCEYLGLKGGNRVWRRGSRLYTWDELHGEIEVFNARGYHLGVLDSTGVPKRGKGAVKGRRIDV